MMVHYAPSNQICLLFVWKYTNREHNQPILLPNFFLDIQFQAVFGALSFSEYSFPLYPAGTHGCHYLMYHCQQNHHTSLILHNINSFHSHYPHESR